MAKQNNRHFNSKSARTLKVLYETTYTGPSVVKLKDHLKESSPVSGRALRQYFFKGLVFLNGKKAHSEAALKNGDIITVYEMGAETPVLKAEQMPLEIVFENNDLLIINKPAGLTVHPVKDIISGTLANGVAAYFEKIGLKAKVRPVNRLDYGTSGLILFAKSAHIQNLLSDAIKSHQIVRTYYALAEGIPKEENSSINLPIGEVKGKRVVTEKGQPAETRYKVIEKFNNASLLEITLVTGRTHQIRVHLSHIGHPIIGDPQYGHKSNLINRPALHAGKLNFEESSLKIPELAVSPPEDFESLRKTLKENF